MGTTESVEALIDKGLRIQKQENAKKVTKCNYPKLQYLILHVVHINVAEIHPTTKYDRICLLASHICIRTSRTIKICRIILSCIL